MRQRRQDIPARREGLPDNKQMTLGRTGKRGFTLLELLITIIIAALLGTLAMHSYRGLIANQKVNIAVQDLAAIAIRIERYRTDHSMQLPMSLDDLGEPAVPLDPWGNAYRYLNFGSGEKGIQGKIRKDHNLHPLNSEFDLYSVGPDGASASPLTAQASRDDVIWARDGSFIGPASDF